MRQQPVELAATQTQIQGALLTTFAQLDTWQRVAWRPKRVQVWQAAMQIAVRRHLLCQII